ncbi:MAG: carbamoyltransferase HypF [Acetobacteraceae bacterium]
MPRHISNDTEDRQRLQVHLTGAVQGVGFRPLAYRLAVDEGLAGFVQNTSDGVTVEVEGSDRALNRFLARLDTDVMPPAQVDTRRVRRVEPQGGQVFSIIESARVSTGAAIVLPDIATCPACLEEVLDPADRRYQYPFTTCMHCGPRYSVIEALPYDRARTTMRHFPLCPACEAEYHDPACRRFHAESIACPECGPELTLWDTARRVLARRDAALAAAADALRDGQIVAMKGLGGFQLLVDARNEPAVRRLRDRKHRPEKPFAIMVATLADASVVADISAAEAGTLLSAAAPIVLLRARPGAVSSHVAPANPWLGVMLPCTPLHHLLTRMLGFPVVATSGNTGGDPIVADESQAVHALAGIADMFLVHDRPIVHPVDDSVVRMIHGQETVLRCARGYAPLVLRADSAVSGVAMGGHQKSAIAIARGRQIILGPHVGDLDQAETRTVFARSLNGMTALYNTHPMQTACDQHPDYYSTRIAEAARCPVHHIPHHLAHVLAGIVDNALTGPVLGVAWDGTGFGNDGTIWGGEFLTVEDRRYRRVAHLLPFRLPGGEAAVREPRRSAIGALFAMFGDAAFDMIDLPPLAAFTPRELRLLQTMLRQGVNTPWTSSAGRLIDAVASILGLLQASSFEGQAAMSVESAADSASSPASLPSVVVSPDTARIICDWRPMLATLLADMQRGARCEDLAAGFHAAMADMIVSVACHVGFTNVLLTGGCFQNVRLTEQAVSRLHAAGFIPRWHHRVPPNDGGLAAGQAAFLCRPLIEERV